MKINKDKIKVVDVEDGTIYSFDDVLEMAGIKAEGVYADYSTAEGRGALNFDKCLISTREKSKDGTREFINFYLQCEPDAKAVQIKLAFYDNRTFKYLLAMSDSAKVFVEKRTSVYLPKEKDSK